MYAVQEILTVYQMKMMYILKWLCLRSRYSGAALIKKHFLNVIIKWPFKRLAGMSLTVYINT